MPDPFFDNWTTQLRKGLLELAILNALAGGGSLYGYDIVRRLGLHEPLRMTTGFDRPNLSYDVVPTKGGAEVWTGSMSNDHVSRLNTKTDEITEYLLPRTTNIRRVFVDETSGKPVLWIGNNHGAAIVKVEPLD